MVDRAAVTQLRPRSVVSRNREMIVDIVGEKISSVHFTLKRNNQVDCGKELFVVETFVAFSIQIIKLLR